MVDITRDMSVGSQMYGWAKANVTYGNAPTWAYFFTRRQPYTPGITFSDHDPATAGAYHTGEVPYFLRNFEAMNMFRRTRDWTPLDEGLRDTMSGLILSFAKTGVPSPTWPKFDPVKPKVMLLGEEVKVIDWPNAKTLPLLAGAKAAPPAPPTTQQRSRD
jgi:para-nitrobenzyl esterase